MSTAIPTFPVLYKANNKGKLSRWAVEIRPESMGTFSVNTTFGEDTGAQQTHVTMVNEGKAKRSPLEQAILLAQSKWNEKTQRDTYTSSSNVTDTVKVVRPMLAQTYDKDKSGKGYTMPFPLFTQRKYDGIRCMCTYKNGEIVLESRKGVAFQLLGHLHEEALATLFPEASPLQELIVFDGELYTPELTFETLSGLVRLTRTKAKSETSVKAKANALGLIPKIEYHVYDFYDPTRPHMPFSERHVELERRMGLRNGTTNIKKVPTLTASSWTDVKRQHDQFVQEGFEGIMLRDPAGTYEIDKRSKYLQKYKEFQEEEFRIVGYHDGEGIDAGLVIWDCVTAEGHPFSAKPRGTQEQRRQWFAEADQHVGKLLTVIFQEFSTDGSPRFPIGKALRGDAIE